MSETQPEGQRSDVSNESNMDGLYSLLLDAVELKNKLKYSPDASLEFKEVYKWFEERKVIRNRAPKVLGVTGSFRSHFLPVLKQAVENTGGSSGLLVSNESSILKELTENDTDTATLATLPSSTGGEYLADLLEWIATTVLKSVENATATTQQPRKRMKTRSTKEPIVNATKEQITKEQIITAMKTAFTKEGETSELVDCLVKAVDNADNPSEEYVNEPLGIAVKELAEKMNIVLASEALISLRKFVVAFCFEVLSLLPNEFRSPNILPPRLLKGDYRLPAEFNENAEEICLSVYLTPAAILQSFDVEISNFLAGSQDSDEQIFKTAEQMGFSTQNVADSIDLVVALECTRTVAEVGGPNFSAHLQSKENYMRYQGDDVSLLQIVKEFGLPITLSQLFLACGSDGWFESDDSEEGGDVITSMLLQNASIARNIVTSRGLVNADTKEEDIRGWVRDGCRCLYEPKEKESKTVKPNLSLLPAKYHDCTIPSDRKYEWDLDDLDMNMGETAESYEIIFKSENTDEAAQTLKAILNISSAESIANMKTDRHEANPLIYHTAADHSKLVAVLIEYFDVNATTSSYVENGDGWGEAEYTNSTALHFAVCNGNYEIAEMLLNAGADVLIKSGWNGGPPLPEYDEDYPEGERWISKDYSYHSGLTALHMAARNGDARMCALIIPYLPSKDEKSVEIDLAANQDGFTPLFFALIAKSKATAEMLLSCGAQVENVKPLPPWTPDVIDPGFLEKLPPKSAAKLV